MYAWFLIPTLLAIFVTGLLVARIGAVAGSQGWTVELLGVIFLSAVIVGSLLSWFANKALVALEGLVQPTIGDHLRQSLLVYAIILVAFLKILFFNEYHFGLNIWPAWGILYLAGWAIFINAVYIYWQCRANRKKQSTKVAPATIGWSIFVGPILVFLLVVVGYYVNRAHADNYYSGKNRPQSDGITPPGVVLPPSLSDYPPTSPMINTDGLPRPVLDYRQ